ncbi:hypothetical protein [Micromonospora globbae]|uniref:hypothetical protein n=1 Tax=Micromonospora globbae TaxID=1894969 RepID=UPI00386D854A|nr:hypothetical protein OH732_01435 [Micromonospora globbae]
MRAGNGEWRRERHGSAAVALAAAVLLPALVACAPPDARPAADAAEEPAAATTVARPLVPEARCAVPGPVVARPPHEPAPARSTPAGATPSRSPLGEEQRREEMLRRQQAANDAFRQRGTLAPEAAEGARACAGEVARHLNLLTAGGRNDADEAAVRRVVEGTGLTSVTVRSPGRLDNGPGDGLLFAGWTGRACVFGSVGQGEVRVEIGAPIADGGCLPAPD